MKPSDINWSVFEDVVFEVVDRCLHELARNPPADPVYAVGIEGLVEQGVISVGANTTAARVPGAEWWMPDWQLTHLDERLPVDPVTSVLRPFAERISAMDFARDAGADPVETYRELVRLFRLACLRALQRVEAIVVAHDFPRSADFELMYMDSDDGFYRGAEGIREGIKGLG